MIQIDNRTIGLHNIIKKEGVLLMKLLPGYEIEYLDAHKMIQVKHKGLGTMRLIGNPNPDIVKRQEIVNNIAEILMRGKARRESHKKSNVTNY